MGICQCLKPRPQIMYVQVPYTEEMYPQNSFLYSPAPIPIGYYQEPSFGLTIVQVDPSVKNQEIAGWGTSLCWWAAQAGTWDAKPYEQAMRLLFSEEGARINTVRYNIGGGENPECPKGKSHMLFERKMPGFKPTPSTWDWNADSGQRRVLKGSIALGVRHIEAFSNSPPYWMTSSKCASGSDGGKVNNLLDTHINDFAEYLTEVCKFFKEKEKITFTSLDPFNESVSDWWKAGGSQEGCHIDIPQQKKIIAAVEERMKSKGLTSTILAVADTNNLQETLNVWQGYDEPTRSKISRLNPHTYSGKERYDVEALARCNKKDLWMSEVCTGDGGHDHNGMKSSIDLAEKIIADVKCLKPKIWVVWQALENEEIMLNSNINYGLIHAVYRDFEHKGTKYTKGQFWPAKQYYTFCQFSRYIRPGHFIIGSNNNNILAALSSSELVIVGLNSTGSNIDYVFDLSKFTNVSKETTLIKITNQKESLTTLPNRPLDGRKLTVTVPANSIVTCVLSASYSGPKGNLFNGEHYRIVNKHSEKSWHVKDGSKEDKALICQNSWKKGDDNFSWKISPSGDGFSYKIENKFTGKAASVADGSEANGAHICQKTFNNIESCKWEIIDNGGGYWRLINRQSGKSATVEGWSKSDGALINQWTYDENDISVWKLEKLQ